MTFRQGCVGLLLCGCAHAPTIVTVTAAAPRAQPQVELAEPEEDFGCAVYAKGGIDESPAAFRACVEHVVATETRCEGGGSPDLSTLELSVTLIDGVGGAVDIPGGRKILDGCFSDVAVQAVLEHARLKAEKPRTPPFEKCEDFAQTTLAITECLQQHVQNERAWLRRERRSYGPVTRPAFDAAASAAKTWMEALGDIEYRRYEGGTVRGPAMLSRIYGAMQKRRARLAAIRTWSATEATPEAREYARSKLAEALRTITTEAEPNEKHALEEEEKTWRVFRDAEVALYEALHPNAHA
ncbi:MAG TPA: hypothetical protein VGH87_29065, partial [Polyangiaceae bacterium]